ncbi:hypothetical protein HPB47_004247 [Ixodes persulcatus]|uniref:Uncharacterized protein n=1 Tax=Ixodes persulcatus TaxID=34615 RepID=A0AC60PGD6_IXOPE|nr:hypothetical protein HPB47_004247 [Ixodes persulcatus]
MSSRGAASAAQEGRGNRNSEMTNQEYQVILPPLPSGLFADVVALGAYQYNHVWAVTFKSQEGKKKILAAGDLTVKDSRCVVIDPCNQDTRLKLH